MNNNQQNFAVEDNLYQFALSVITFTCWLSCLFFFYGAF